ncbi:MAG: oligopeptide transporter, OPT family, partial [Saprospiraceae bacterium]|nr:oligopeptide transporter, OPT family [Saprospiraceae bacterium]
MAKKQPPHISPEIKLPETTLKAFVLGALLSVILAGANAYLGLFAGMTVSASIPAAVLSMAILKLFKNSNILENNIVQTAASAGESLAAGVIFTFPALVLMGYWTEFNYLETTLIALCGGVLGVLFTIPLRQALIVEQDLKFPEGVATSEVLKTGEKGGDSVKYLIWGGLVGAGIKFCEAGLKIWYGTAEAASIIGRRVYTYAGINLSPALIAVGYIVGFHIASLVFLGGVISWWVAIPIYVGLNGAPDGVDAAAVGGAIWSSQIRYLGVGAMVVGGIWALISLRSSIGFALKNGLEALKNGSKKLTDQIRTEQDTPMSWVIIAVGVMVVPIFIIYLREIGTVPITAMMSILMVIAGFLFAAVAGYMAGLVGSSNNPISGVTIATILTSALILLALMGSGAEKGPAAAIMIGAVVCCAAAIAGDNMQDLKAGHILGATPFRQQMMQMVGVVSAAFALPLILQLLLTAYGFGPATPERPDSLTAPQATLMESVARGVFSGDLPWTMVFIGAAIGVVIILLDLRQERRGSFRLPVLAIAVGLYLPFELDSAIWVGGVIALLVSRYQDRKKSKLQDRFEEASQRSDQTGLLLASGLITGEALIGIILALPIAITEDTNFFAIMENPIGSLPGLLVIISVCWWLYKIAVRAF